MGFVLDDSIASPAPEVATALEKVVESLGRAGATMKPGWPTGLQPAALLETYLFMLSAFFTSMAPPTEQQAQREKLANAADPMSVGARSSFADWQRQNLQRLAFRAQWQAYFDEVDVFLSPVAFATAFPHDHTEPQSERSIATVGGPRRYMDFLNWVAPATLTGCPATVAPIGRTQAGLPVGIQIMGPYWEDATTITFAELLAREVGGFVAPAGYDK